MKNTHSRQLVACPFCGKFPLEKHRGLEGHIKQRQSCSQARDRRHAELRARNQLSSQPSETDSTLSHHPSTYQDGSTFDPDLACDFSDGVSQNDTMNMNRDDEPDQPASRDRSLSPDFNGNDDGNPGQAETPVNPSGPYQYLDRDPELEPKIGAYIGTKWEEMKAREKDNLPFYPWASRAEFEIVNWLATEGLSQKAIDRFLQSKYVSFGFEIDLRQPFQRPTDIS